MSGRGKGGGSRGSAGKAGGGKGGARPAGRSGKSGARSSTTRGGSTANPSMSPAAQKAVAKKVALGQPVFGDAAEIRRAVKAQQTQQPMGKGKRGRPATTRQVAVPPARTRRAAAAGGRPEGRPGEGRPPERTLGGEQVEGRQSVRELLLAGTRKVYEVWLSTEIEGSDIVDDIRELAAARRIPVVEVARKRLESEARSEAPQGVLAKAAPIPEHDLDDLLARRGGKQPFLLAVDGVTDPGNLGALLRSAEGAGVTGVVLPKHRAVHVTPTCSKSAAGAVEHLRMTQVGGLPTALARMRERGVWVVGLDDAADRSLFELGDLAADAICLVLGAEGAGLSRLVRERCDLLVSIPMLGRLSSLNVSAAGAVACFEVTRARAR